MKILQVTHRFYPTSGGGSYVVYNLSKYLKLKNNDITIITSDYNYNDNYVAYLRTIGVKIITFPTVFKVGNFIVTKNMINWIKSNIGDFDVIHLHGVRTYQNIVVTAYAKKNHIPVVCHAHGSMSRIGYYKFFKKIYDKLFLRKLITNISIFIALSKSEKKVFSEIGIPSDKTTVIPNGVDLEKFKNLPQKGIFRTKYNINREEKILLYIGRIDITKGLDLLVQSYHHIYRSNRHVKLVIIGKDTGYKKELIKLIDKLCLQKGVILIDYISEEEKLSAMLDSDVFITPRFYGFPITFVEACACGLPLVTTDDGDYLDWIHNNTGFVTTYDELEMKNYILQIIENRNLWTYFSNNCRSIVRSEFNWAIIANKLISIYKSLIDSTTRRGNNG